LNHARLARVEYPSPRGKNWYYAGRKDFFSKLTSIPAENNSETTTTAESLKLPANNNGELIISTARVQKTV